MKRQLTLTDLRSVRYSDWISTVASTTANRFCVATSGYESRSVTWVKRTLAQLDERNGFDFHVVGFEDFKDALSRPSNDDFYESANIEIRTCGSSRETDFLSELD